MTDAKRYAVTSTERHEGRRKTVGRDVGATGFRFTHFDSQPGQAGFEHDERTSGQEEAYVAIRGAGVIRVDGAEIDFSPGLYVLVQPEAARQVVAGDEGLSYVVFGAPPGALEI
jgi:mannose-6-phosphate isomerase-like protein (cupin superfamily)